MTSAVTEALRDRIEREKRLRSVDVRVQKLLALGERCAAYRSRSVRDGARRRSLRRAGIAQVIVDTSAILAVLFKEADTVHFARMIAATSPCRVSVANLLEASIVIGGRGDTTDTELDLLGKEAEIELIPATTEQIECARKAWRRFGKGNHPAGLNFGDCSPTRSQRRRESPSCSKVMIFPARMSKRHNIGGDRLGGDILQRARR